MKKLLAIYVLGLTAMVAAIPAAKAGTIALWTFEDGTIGAPASSITPTVGGFTGTANNGPTYVDGYKSTFGNTGLQFNGSNQNVLIPTTSGDALDLTGSFTIELGVTSGNNGGFALFMGGSAPGEDPYYINILSNGAVQFQTQNSSGLGATSIFSSVGAITPGESAHIAAVYDESGPDNFMHLYVDALLVGSANLGTDEVIYTDPNRNLWLGSVDNGQFGFYDGVITDVRISDMALETSEFFQVPEPGMILVFGLGLAGLAFSRRQH